MCKLSVFLLFFLPSQNESTCSLIEINWNAQWKKLSVFANELFIYIYIYKQSNPVCRLFTSETVSVCHSTVYQLLWGWAELAVGGSRRSFCLGGGRGRGRWNMRGDRLVWYPCTDGLCRAKITQAAVSSCGRWHRTHRTGAAFFLKDICAHTLSLVTTVIRQLLCVKVPLPAGVYRVLCLNK